MTALAVTVLGVPVPQGSMKSLGPRRLVHSNAEKLRPWRDTVAWQIRQTMADLGMEEPLAGPVGVQATFSLVRPQSASKSRWAPDRRPDLDKLTRALLDSLTMGGAVIDDAQVVTLAVSKVYAVPPAVPGVTFTVAPAERGEAVAA